MTISGGFRQKIQEAAAGSWVSFRTFAAQIAEIGVPASYADLGSDSPLVEIRFSGMSTTGTPTYVTFKIWRKIGLKEDVIGRVDIPAAEIASWPSVSLECNGQLVGVTVTFTGGTAPTVTGALEIRQVYSGEATAGSDEIEYLLRTMVTSGVGGGGASVGGGNNIWSNPQDFAAAANSGAKTITINGFTSSTLSSVLTARNFASAVIKRISSTGDVDTIPTTNVAWASPTLTLDDMTANFAVGDTVLVMIPGPDKAYNETSDAQFVQGITDDNAVIPASAYSVRLGAKGAANPLSSPAAATEGRKTDLLTDLSRRLWTTLTAETLEGVLPANSSGLLISGFDNVANLTSRWAVDSVTKAGRVQGITADNTAISATAYSVRIGAKAAADPTSSPAAVTEGYKADILTDLYHRLWVRLINDDSVAGAVRTVPVWSDWSERDSVDHSVTTGVGGGVTTTNYVDLRGYGYCCFLFNALVGSYLKTLTIQATNRDTDDPSSLAAGDWFDVTLDWYGYTAITAMGLYTMEQPRRVTFLRTTVITAAGATTDNTWGLYAWKAR